MSALDVREHWNPLRDADAATSSQHVSGQEPTVLALQHASPSLAESDFRRIIPGGKHIKGWKDEAKLLKVITGRDPQTLTPLGFYYLLFASPSSAKAYRDRVMYLHRIARTYTPQSLESPLPPPPGYMIDGEDAHALLHSYNLVPPSQNLVLRLLTPPFPRHLQQLIHHGGYSRVKMRNCGADHTVLLYVTGAQLRTWSIQRMIEEDGRNNRNALWRLAGGTHGITEMNSPVFNEPEAEEGEEDDMAYPTSVRGQSRWLLEFEDRAEALRFVRAWHKRPFPLRRDSTAAATMADDDGPNDDDDAPTVHAELIW
ncbi:MAG: hypothetical protein M1838_000617 [Thelocarpon superellum]|nr:MAG: hypothetical protein M1838_000617 [Thelocarpon superellum]